MGLTRANTEFLIIPRVGPLMVAADMDGSTVDGSNADLNGPIGKAIRYLGYSVASPVLVTDADVANVTDTETDQYLDLVTLYTLNAILGNLDDTEIRVGPRTEKLNQLAERVERAIDRVQDNLKADYGFGLDILTAGYYRLDRAEHDV